MRPAHEQTARSAVERARDLLAQPTTLDSYDWLLIVTLLIEADKALSLAREKDPDFELPMLTSVLEELSDVTSNFTAPAFLAATKSARRQNTALFLP